MHSSPNLSNLQASTAKLLRTIVSYVLFWFRLPIFIELVENHCIVHLFDVLKRPSTIEFCDFLVENLRP